MVWNVVCLQRHSPFLGGSAFGSMRSVSPCLDISLAHARPAAASEDHSDDAAIRGHAFIHSRPFP
eukprot:890109-Prymnesium_polylepis.1